MKDNTMSDNTKRFIKSARDLHVYKRAYAVSLEIHQESLGFPKMEQFSLADQLRRATKSICANLAEGFVKQRKSDVEFARFILMAEASCGEILVWLDYASDLGYIPQEKYLKWQDDYEAISAMLHNLRTKS